ncbi:MAG: c-type cytochrome [Bacteroidetes bacterium]|nr:c-type cytochrome [Bacteroidota bacterium]
MNNEQRYRYYFSKSARILAMVIIFVLVIGWINEGLFPSWKRTQRTYRKVLKREYHDQAMRNALIPEAGVYQIQLPELHRTDRCITCHLAINGALIDSMQEPYLPHPGTYLDHHPVKRYGCTICHGGQGQALDKRDAFAQNPRNAWDQPVLDSPFIESSCGKCHLSLFSANSVLKNTRVLHEGRSIFLREGCLGCHKARDVGGILGPDLTGQGDKSKHEYNFRNIQGTQTISNWLEQHFKDPEMVSPGSRMLQYDLPESELVALATLVMGLSNPDIPYQYIGLNVISELKGNRPDLSGEPLYQMVCSACHGKIGEGKPYASYKTGVPAIGQPGFLAIASDSYISTILHYGRLNQQMASWAPDFSGLTPEELNNLNQFVRSRRVINSTWDQTLSLITRGKGSKTAGKELFEQHCKTCHGADAKGGLAIGFNNPDFFRAASKEYIYNTLLNGRMNTAMPSWSMFTDQEMGDVIAYVSGMGNIKDRSRQLAVGSWQSAVGSWQHPGSGSELFHYACSRCHGEHGEGNTGPAILNRDFIRTADDHFLYQTISRGRAHTPMHGWIRAGSQEGGLNQGEIREIIGFIRSCEDTVWKYNYPGPTLGNKEAGKKLFGELCAGCHGVHGGGLKAPSLNDQQFLNAATNGFILATITLGRHGTPMPEWGTDSLDHQALTAEQRNDIVAFIRSWQTIRLPIK